MHCPFYLVVASFITEDGKHIWNEYVDVNSEEVDIDSLESVMRSFPSNLEKKPVRVTVIRNNTEGGPTVVQDWG